jgi:hypothetical protein
MGIMFDLLDLIEEDDATFSDKKYWPQSKQDLFVVDNRPIKEFRTIKKEMLLAGKSHLLWKNFNNTKEEKIFFVHQNGYFLLLPNVNYNFLPENFIQE